MSTKPQAIPKEVSSSEKRRFRPVLVFETLLHVHQNHRLWDNHKDTWSDLTQLMEGIIEPEVEALAGILKGIHGAYTEAEYRDQYNKVLSARQKKMRTDALTEKARKSLEEFLPIDGSRTAEVLWSMISDIPVLSSSFIAVTIGMKVGEYGKFTLKDVRFVCSQRYTFSQQWLTPAQQPLGRGGDDNRSNCTDNTSEQASSPDHSAQSEGQSFSDFSNVTDFGDNVDPQQRMTYPSYTSGASPEESALQSALVRFLMYGTRGMWQEVTCHAATLSDTIPWTRHHPHQIEPKFRPVFSFLPEPNLSGPLGGLKFDSWGKLNNEMDKLIKKELAALVSKLQSINGVFTEDSYRERCDELFSQSLRDTRAAALAEAGRKAAKKLSGMRNSVTVTRPQVTVGPFPTKFSNLGVGIDVSICKRGYKNCVSSCVFTGEQEYSVERRALEHTERNLDDVDQPMGSDDDQHDGVSQETSSTNKTGSYLSSKQTKQSSNDDGTSVSAQTPEGRQSMSDVRR
ncbi:hypothetical protein FFLO_04630 [Filobasidium floriforme]|uniref:Uncharacterized protein n=1 Tax=Filobasidium floriforme TaxID=5210 RepID=A0A8K0JII4_9TREE|nr:uncharacterized protein HD553DRAFT_325729 [Filobasidium floriforme]KAG7531019.1 hypothetical protein FFLO_04630 [Filobasidium floriforme]KAH8080754.1 hypothetical protein HD553DRAFT_325729 [Filobasidium floriforme]